MATWYFGRDDIGVVMKSVAFIETNFTGMDAIKKAAAIGIKCYLVTSDFQLLKKLLPEELFSDFDNCAEIIPVKNSDDVIEVSEALAGLKLSAVITFSQFRLIATTQIAKKLGLMATSERAISLAIDKFALRQAMENAGAPSVKCLELKAGTTAKDIINKVGLPCIFKPSKGHSSLSIALVRTEDQLNVVLRNSISNLLTNDVIVEEYLEGPLYSLESVTTSPGNHIFWGFTDRILTTDFIEMGATFPVMTPDGTSAKALVTQALDAIGFDFGSCHTEMIFTTNGPRLVEVNPRIGGSGISRLIERASGQDIVVDYLKMFLGEALPSIKSLGRSVTMRSVLPERSGRIVRLPTREQTLVLPGIKDVWFQRKIGDLTDDSRSNFSWLFTIVAEPTHGKTSVENADAAIRLLSSEIEIVSASSVGKVCSA